MLRDLLRINRDQFSESLRSLPPSSLSLRDPMSSSSKLVMSSNISTAAPRQAKRKRLLKVCDCLPFFRPAGSILSCVNQRLAPLAIKVNEDVMAQVSFVVSLDHFLTNSPINTCSSLSELVSVAPVRRASCVPILIDASARLLGSIVFTPIHQDAKSHLQINSLSRLLHQMYFPQHHNPSLCKLHHPWA